MMRKELWFLILPVACAVSMAFVAIAPAEEAIKGRVAEGVVAGQKQDADSTDVADRAVVAGRSIVAGPEETAGVSEKESPPAPVVEPVEKEEVSSDQVVTQAVPEDVELESGAVFELLPAGRPEALPGEIEVEEGVSVNLISISLDEVPVPDVVDMFSRISGANIIIAGTFTNLFITATLKDVEWNSALNLVLGSVNLSLIEDPSGILMVVTSEMYSEKLKQIEETKPLVTKIFSPMYLNVVDLVEQIKKLKILSPRGTIITSQSKEQDVTNLKSSSLATVIIQNPSITTEIIVTDIKEYVDRVEMLIRDLDRREPQVFIEARIIDVVSSDSTKLGFDWEMLDNFGVSAGLRDLKWTYSDTHTADSTQDKRDYQYDQRSSLDGINKRYDIDGNPYEESVTTYEESPPDSGNWVARTVVTPTRTISDDIKKGREVTSDYADKVRDAIVEAKVASAIMDVSDASLFISALKRTADAEIISHPLLIVGNNVEAKIHVGERYPTVFSEKVVDSSGGISRDSYSEKVEWNDLGLTLWVIPEIDSESDVVRLTVNPQMSEWIKDITTPQGSVFPVISTRHLSSRVTVPSGYTVAIGGLIKNREEKREKRVPILGDIPLLGLLFRHTEDVRSKSNLIILLTPTILSEEAPTTGFEAIAQQTVERLEKVPLSPKKAVVTEPVLPKDTSKEPVNTATSVPLPEPEPGEPSETSTEDLPE